MKDRRLDEVFEARSPGSSATGRRRLRAAGSTRGIALGSCLLVCAGIFLIAAPAGAQTTVGPVSVANVFLTPACWFQPSGCSTGDFPVDWGTVRTFSYSLPSDFVVEDVLIQGNWGGGNGFYGSAPAAIYVEGIFIDECFRFAPCWFNDFPSTPFNGGSGFWLSDLGVDFGDPGVQAAFADGAATFQVVQWNQISVNLTTLRATIVPEPDVAGATLVGVAFLALLAGPRRSMLESAG